MESLLITTATRPPENIFMLRMTSHSKRLILARAAVLFWACNGIKRIVIADATGHQNMTDEDVKILDDQGVQVEQISYIQDQKSIIARGKGYGEGKLIKQALEQSKFLKEANHFYKCTGKIYCQNFSNISKLIKNAGANNVFWEEPHGKTIDARFYYTSKLFFENVLGPAYEMINDNAGITAENVLYDAAISALSKTESIRPLLSGFSGSLDKQYVDNGRGLMDKTFPCWVS